MITKSILAKEDQEIETKKEPVILFTVASKNYMSQAIPFINSLRKFHDFPIILYTDETDPEKLPKVKNLIIADLVPYLEDQQFYYRQKPILAEPLLDKYDLVIGADADQLVLGDLNAILESKDFDAGVVINWNRFDEKYFPAVEISRLGIPPVGYYNCGLVALRSKAFCHNWLVNCYTQEFNYMQYREQDVLNILCHFGNWNVRAFDMPDGPDSPVSWYGIVGKGEWVRAVVEDNKVMVKKGLGPTPFPPTDVQIRVIHWGGGNAGGKCNWDTICSDEMMKRIHELTK